MGLILVTGGAGFIGSHVVDALIDEGHKVDVIDNLSTGSIKNVNIRANFIAGDIRQPLTGQYDYIFHVAALARVQPSIEDPVTWNDTNVNGTLQILELARECGAKVIYSSSSSIYKGDKLPTKEEDAKEPKSPYALQKWIGEQYCELYSKLYGVKYVALRYFSVYGERQLPGGAYATVIGTFLNQKANGDKLYITGTGQQRRDFTYVKDVARANIKAMSWEGVYNIGAGKNYSINEIAKMIGGKTEYVPKKPGEVRETLADNTKARLQSWKPTVKVEEWLKSQ